MPRLLVLPCSARKHRTARPVPAWYRYGGILLQEPVSRASGSVCWWGHPAMHHAFEVAWLQHLHRLRTAPRKEQAIRMVFKNHPAGGQAAPPARHPLRRMTA
jgi:hypothetical protein